MRLDPGSVVDVLRVEVERAGSYRLRLFFSDGAERIVDFEPFLRASGNPLIRCFLDPELFATWRVDGGDLIWGDYDLCFPVADLYENRI